MPKKYRSLQSRTAVTGKKMLQFIDITQRIIEYRFFDMRKMLCQYASLIEQQRQLIQMERQEILTNKNYLIRAESYRGYDPDPKKLARINHWLLYQYDQAWAQHLEILSQLREGIHFVKLGGQNPLQLFRKRAVAQFDAMQSRLRQEVEQAEAALFDPEQSFLGKTIERPTSTWTYIINNNPFSDQLALMLADNSNIGMQVDFISAFALFAAGLHQKWKQRKK